MEVMIRPAKPEDRAFIISTWTKGQLYGHSFFSAVDPDAYFAHYPQYITSVLDSTTTEVLLACLPEDLDIILAYVVFKGPGVAWAFTKKAWRGQGLIKQLTQGRPITVVYSLTKPGQAIMLKKGLKFDPWGL